MKEKFQTLKQKVTKTLTDKIFGQETFDPDRLKEIESDLQVFKNNLNKTQVSITTNKLEVIELADELQRLLAQVKQQKTFLILKTTTLVEKYEEENAFKKKTIDLLYKSNVQYKAAIQALSKEIDKEEKNLGVIKVNEGTSQIDLEKYRTALEKATEGLEKLEQEFKIIQKEDITVNSGAQQEELQEAHKKIAKSLLLNKNKALFTNQRDDNQKLLAAEEIKLAEYKREIEKKKREIDAQKEKIGEYQQQIDNNETEQKKLKEEYETTTKYIANLKPKLNPNNSYSAFDYDEEHSLTSSLCDGIRDEIQQHKEKLSMPDTVFENKEEEYIFQPAPRNFANYSEAHNSIKKLFDYNYITEEDEIKLHLAIILPNTEDKQDHYNYLKSFASEETGLVEGEKLKALQQDIKFKALYKLVLQNNQEQDNTEVLDQPAFEESKNDLQQKPNNVSWTNYCYQTQNNEERQY